MTSIAFLAEEIVSFLGLWPYLVVHTDVAAADFSLLISDDAWSPLVWYLSGTCTHGLYGQTGDRVGRSLPMLRAKHRWIDRADGCSYREVFVRATSDGIQRDEWGPRGPMNYHIKAAFTPQIVPGLEEKHRLWCRRLVLIKQRDERHYVTMRSWCRQQGPHGLHWQRLNVQMIKDLRIQIDEQALIDDFAQGIQTWRRVIDDVRRDVAKFIVPIVAACF